MKAVRTKSRKNEDKMTLQKFVLKKNQLNFLANQDVNENPNTTKPKTGPLIMDKLISEDEFSSSSSYLESLSEDNSGGIKEMKYEIKSKSRKSKKKSLHEKTLENFKQINQINCTIERMLQGRSSKISELSSFMSGAKNQDSRVNFQ